MGTIGHQIASLETGKLDQPSIRHPESGIVADSGTEFSLSHISLQLTITKLENVVIPTKLEIPTIQIPVGHMGSSREHGAEPLRWVAMGDAGSGLPAQKRLADRLMEYHDQFPYSVCLLLGDNMYPNGDTLKYGEARFTSIYRPLLERGVTFLPVLGNHDIAGPLGVGYPSFWMSNQRENMRFFNMPATFYDVRMGPIHICMLNTNHFKTTQRQWLSEHLGRSDSHWKIVCGHHPVFSSGFHGSTPRMRRRLQPLLEKHCVPLHLSAHEHDYERFHSHNGVTYIVSGGGGADLRNFKRPLPHSVVRESQHHFLAFECWEDALHITTINDQGVVIDQVTLASSQQGNQPVCEPVQAEEPPVSLGVQV